MGFATDVKNGMVGEQLIIDTLKEHGYEPISNPGKKPHLHDIQFWHNDELIKCEVKKDDYFEKSKNIALEYANPRKKLPSGLYKSDSDVWFHIINNDNIFFCLTEHLRSFVENTEPDKVVKWAGDGNAALKLYKDINILDVVLQEFKIDLLQEKLEALIKERTEVNEFTSESMGVGTDEGLPSCST